MEKMTKKEMFTFIAEQMADYDNVVQFCNDEIEALAKRAAKSKESAAKKRVESGNELKDAVLNALSTTDFEPIATIAARIPGDDMTVGKCTYRLTALVAEGLAEKDTLVIPGGEGKRARRIAGYRAIVREI